MARTRTRSTTAAAPVEAPVPHDYEILYRDGSTEIVEAAISPDHALASRGPATRHKKFISCTEVN